MPDMQQRVEAVLEQIRPYLLVDGGGVEFMRFDAEHGILEVRLTGACATCAMSPLTLRAGVERALMRALPEIRRVEAVWDNVRT